MPDVYLPKDARKLLENKKVVFIGDSNIRALYKDMVTLLQAPEFVKPTDLKSKLERSFRGDELEDCSRLSRGRDFREQRHYKRDGFDVTFYFVTNIYNSYTTSMFKSVAYSVPDIVIVNSCLWDINRWGPRSIEFYQVNLNNFFKLAKRILHPNCVLIWLTAAPISSTVSSGFLIKELEFMNSMLGFHVTMANKLASELVKKYRFDLVDSYYHLQSYLHLRAKDGVHWLSPAMRYVNNLILTHLSITLGQSLPGRVLPYSARHGYPANFKDVLNQVDAASFNKSFKDLKDSVNFETPKRLKQSVIDCSIKQTPTGLDDYIMEEMASPCAFKCDLHFMTENYKFPVNQQGFKNSPSKSFKKHKNSFKTKRAMSKDFRKKIFKRNGMRGISRKDFHKDGQRRFFNHGGKSSHDINRRPFYGPDTTAFRNEDRRNYYNESREDYYKDDMEGYYKDSRDSCYKEVRRGFNYNEQLYSDRENQHNNSFSQNFHRFNYD